ncbi:MAG TPA: DUF6443 domain-containing protein [Chitinophaga sp.]|uniref:DUF6443 domain-containing protein n=1 Tax=Chitinophaga sp. TaxID=1869181 RepID=UPI002C85ADD2|nr:DUF6443 domain-containing protein [Chitinophaga sp.]HVI48129.1 DUF6443 domain-containing protein [Chitinophaga sp.]
MRKIVFIINILLFFLLSTQLLRAQCTEQGPYLEGTTVSFGIGVDANTLSVSWSTSAGQIVRTAPDGSFADVQFPGPGYYTVEVRYYQNMESRYECWNVRMAANLAGGTITLNTPRMIMNDVFEYSQVISNTGATGGTGIERGLPYAYQWEESADGNTWVDIPGATGVNCTGSNIAIGKIYFRRRVQDDNQTAYSNVINVTPTAALTPGIINSSQMINVGAAPTLFTGNDATGGNGTYQYQWESSLNGLNWSTISGITTVNYQAPALSKTTYYRRKCASDIQFGYSNIIQVLVSDQVAINVPDGSTATGGTTRENIPDYAQFNSASFNKAVRYAIFKPGVTNSTQIATLNNQRDFQKAISYLDGLGRPIETVLANAGTDNTDLVGINVFDRYGNNPIQPLPYLAASNSTTAGSFRNDVAARQPEFYNNLTKNQEDFFYTKTNDEFSPINQASQLLTPGKSFAGSERGKTSTLRPNQANENVRIWSLGNNDNDMPVSYSMYNPGSLRVSVLTNEHNLKESRYCDRQGRLIMSATQSGSDAESGELRTYYVYGATGAARYIITPLAVKYCISNNNWDFRTPAAAAILNELCYRYTYDVKGRPITVKKPGINEADTYVYDIRDRCTFYQHPLLKSKGEWLLYFYDGLDRLTTVATYKNPAATRESLQTMLDQAGITNQAITFSNPPVANLYVDSRNTQPLYEATQSIDFVEPFYSPANDNFDTEINPNAVPVVENIGVYSTAAAISGYTPIAIYYYDNYNAQGVKPFNGTFSLDAGSNLYADPVTPSNNSRGKLTTVKLKVTGKEQWLTSTFYYDQKGRQIQVQTENIAGGTDMTTAQYDFNGKVLSTHQVFKNPLSSNNAVIQLQTRYSYDAIGSMTQIDQRILNAATPVTKLLSSFTYDNLGRPKTKQLSDLEMLNFTYTLDNKLKGINSEFAQNKMAGNYFGMELFYDNGFVKKDYTGNVAGVTWRRKGNPDEWHAYGYTYDNAGRLSKADYSQFTSGNWNNGAVDYSSAIPQYDENGNIKRMKQQGMLAGNVKSTIDDLTYINENNEWSNKLKGVTDIQGDKHLGDFKNYQGRTGTDDYVYDDAGNLIKDKNKGITIANNYIFGKPERITLDGTNKSIEYVYDVTGNVLQKKVSDGSKTTTYSYLDGCVFKDNELLYIPHPEGRIRRSANGTLVYDYFISDYLGNVRTVITDETSQLYYRATHEDNPQPAPPVPEREIFSFPPNIDVIPPGHKFYDYNGTNRKFVKLNNTSPERKIGTGKVLRVMAGDKVELSVMSYYQQNSPANNTSNQVPADIVQQLINTLIGPASVIANGKNNLVQGNTSGLILNKDEFTDFVTNTQTQNPPSNVPKAYLNYALFDENFKMVSGSALRVNTPDAVTPLAAETNVTKNGFLYVYVSNESPTDVFFDDLVVRHTTGHLLQEDSYYPYGLQIAGLSSKALNRQENLLLFNGIEKINEFDLELFDAFYRTLDPQIGRWWQVDPKHEQFHSLSPYHVSVNNPVNFSDPLGDSPPDWFRNGNALIWKNSEAASLMINGQLFENVGKNLIQTVGDYTYIYFGEKLVSATSANLINAGQGFIRDLSRMSFSTLQDVNRNLYKAKTIVETTFRGTMPTSREETARGGGGAKKDSNPYEPGTFTHWNYTNGRDYSNQVEAYRAWQSYSGYHPGEEFWDRTFRLMAHGSAEARREYASGGMDMYSGFAKTARAVEAADEGLSFNRGVLEKFMEHAFARGRHADLNLSAETMASKGLYLVEQNMSLLKAGDNTLIGNVNGVQKSFKVFVQDGKIMSVNMYPGVSNRVTQGSVINFGNVTW